MDDFHTLNLNIWPLYLVTTGNWRSHLVTRYIVSIS